MVNFWRGRVRLEAAGGFPERFLSEAAAAGIPLFDISRRDWSLLAGCAARDYRRLRPIARKSGVRMRVTHRSGLPFLLRPLRWRWGLAVGAVAAGVLLHLLSSRVWIVTVSGNTTLPSETILSVLEPLGVRVGGDFRRVDVPTAQLIALQQLPELGWLAVNQQGCTVEVRVRERDPSLPLQDNTPANIVAACDGVILSLTVTGGQAAVRVGDAVTAGTLLISGITDSQVGPLLQRASGSVKARCTVELSVTVPLNETVPTVGKRVVRPSLVLFGWRIPLYTNSRAQGDYTESIQEHRLTANHRPLPVGWSVTEWRFAAETTVQRSEQQALTEAWERLEQQAADTLTDMTVESCERKHAADGQQVTVTAVYTVVREIGELRPLSTS